MKAIQHLRICSNHFKDYGIREFIIKNETDIQCSYCLNPSSAALSSVVKIIEKGIYVDYTDLYSGAAIWDSEKGEFDVESYNAENILQEEIGLQIQPVDLYETIISQFQGKEFCDRYPYTPNPEDQLIYNWRYFEHYVKYKARYIFTFPIERETQEGDIETIIPGLILDDIGKAINELKLYTSVTEPLFGIVQAYRSRQHDYKSDIRDYRDIGPAPREKAWSNRFSPAGIPMFYGTEDEATAIEEVINREKKEQLITTALFRTNRTVNLIDLTLLPFISPFDTFQNKLIYAVRFLQEFIERINKPIPRNGSEHIEYVPTQIITEYLRDVLPKVYKGPIEGIKYTSTKIGKVSYVLFCNIDDVSEDNSLKNDKLLTMFVSSVKTQKVANL